jgi:hypothetical protein
MVQPPQQPVKKQQMIPLQVHRRQIFYNRPLGSQLSSGNNNSCSNRYTISSAQQRALPISSNDNNYEQQLIQRILLSHLSTRNNNRNNNSNNQPVSTAAETHPILDRAADTIRNIWATSTWSARAHLWQRLNQYATQHQIQHLPLGVQAMAFVSNNTHLTPQTQYTYAKTFRALASRFAMTTPVLDLYIAALRAAGSTIPTEQAVPATRQQVIFLITKAMEVDKRLAAALYILWKSAARWDDVKNLTKESLIHNSNNKLVIEWGQTKTSRGQPFRVSGWTVIQEIEFPIMVQETARTFAQLQENEHLYPVQTHMFVRWIRQFQQTQDLTAHSFKRGAIGVLVQQAALGNVEPRLITVLAKHKDPLHDFPVSTLRYAPNKVQLAEMLGTQHATKLL